jgi:hypothetical protein
MVKTKQKAHGLGDLTVKEAYEIVCNDLKAIYVNCFCCYRYQLD